MKIDRLVAILVILLRKDRVRAGEMAEKFNVSIRTILRDVDALNLAGIPIVTYQGANGGIGIVEGYRLDKSVLTEDEMASIITTLKGIDATMLGKNHEILMEKLKNTLSSAQLEMLKARLKHFVIDLSPWHEDTLTKEKLALIHQAIEAFRELEFSYIDGEGKKSSRRVEPYSLILKTQNWYLYAWCCLRNDFRYFKISRIRELTVKSVSFAPRETPPENLPDDRGWLKPENLVALELVFEKEMESRLAEWTGAGIENCPDGRIMVKTTLPENAWLYGFLLSFGTAVEVINPPHIRTAVAEIARGIYQKYLPEHDR